MSDAGAIVADEVTLSSLVREAFIDPIRSVLIIDDEYPTWEQIFGAEGYDPKDTSARWAVNSKILEVIKQFRRKSPALTVDIHDGSKNDEIGSYLHQSDLLVLDYQLEKAEPHGVRAVDIIDDLLSSRHFNLVVVHTALGELTTPFNHVLMSLLCPLALDPTQVQAGFELVRQLEESEDGNENAVADIRAAVSESNYIAFRKAVANGKTARGLIGTPQMVAFKAICDNAGWDYEKKENVFLWAISGYEDRLIKANAKPREIRWNSPGEPGRPWIRSGGGFIAFADKNNTELLKTLGEALEDWKPSPSRMISSKIRSEISAQGVVAEDTALADKHAYWQYYQELRAISSDGSKTKNHRKTLIEAHAARHTERLFDMVGEEAVKFGLKLVDCDPVAKNPDAKDGFSTHYNVNAKSPEDRVKALQHYNAYISTKPVSGWHLQPGHVFKVGGDLWVCVSPACDLVPMQKPNAGMHESTKASTKPFIAVQLHNRNGLDAGEVNSNTLVFLRDMATGKINTYSVYQSSGGFGSPVWRLFLAADFGRFTVNEDKTADLRLSYVFGEEDGLHVENCESKIVGHLRYEYALNLVQKLGVEFTRIGLDFVAPG
ncbi:MAG: hypothetical protein J0H01_36215 [Rhizobiales bacterium]|nr:hypothetical protein [Hyphomicrobiales bacterium]